MKGKYWWIKERRNPQLGTYYMLYGKACIDEQERAEEKYRNSEEFKIECMIDKAMMEAAENELHL